jgi:thiol:disulfide interchange protein DsbA
MKNFKLLKLSLFFVLTTSFSVNTFAEYKLGRDYSKISNPLTVKQDGIVDVMEVFWYGCGACYSIEGPVNGWKKTLPDHVNFTKFPVTWGPIHQTHAALYHTIEALDLTQKAHSAVFVSIHKEKNFLRNEKAITDFLKGFGVAPETSSAYLNSFAVKQKVSRGIKISKQLQLGSTPMLIVDGTYIIQPKRTYEEMFKVAEYVIELQKTNS